MKSTGMVRKLDELGRVVIPIEIRNKLRIAEKDPIEIYVSGSTIVLKKVEEDCVFCGSNKGVVEFKEKLICNKCAKQVNSLIK